MAKSLELRFPVAGVFRRLGFDRISAARTNYPTPFAVNVRPEDPRNKRMRGGSRPGLTDYTGTVPSLPAVNLEDESGNIITTEAGVNITVDQLAIEALNAEVMAAVKAFGIGTLTDAVSASSGTAPTGYTMGCLYRDRLVLSGADNAIYMSRMSGFTDWDYGAHVGDVGRAFLFQLSQAGEQGDTVTALIPFRDTYLIAATEHSLWLVKGDPVADGSLQKISGDVGILSNTAWCLVDSNVVFLSNDGLYSVGVNGSGLENLSGDKLPEEMQDSDTSTVDIHLGYNHGESGVYIFLVGSDYHWYFDRNYGGFWPFTLPSANDPSAVFDVEGQLILFDGSSSYWSIEGETDDGTAIESHLLLGPLKLGNNGMVGKITELHGALDTGSTGRVKWYIIPADTAEEAAENGKAAIEAYLAGTHTTAEAYTRSNGTLANSRSRRWQPRCRGMYAVIWLRSNNQWAYETVVAEVQANAGRWRY